MIEFLIQSRFSTVIVTDCFFPWQVWQAIEKVLLEDSLAHPATSNGQETSEESHFTQLAPARVLSSHHETSEDSRFTNLAPACPNGLQVSATTNGQLHLQIPEDEQQAVPYIEANTDACKVNFSTSTLSKSWLQSVMMINCGACWWKATKGYKRLSHSSSWKQQSSVKALPPPCELST